LIQETDMTTLQRLLPALILALAAAAGCTTVQNPTGKPCERCSRGYYPVDDRDRTDRRAVCIVRDHVTNCDRIPAECSECARLQRRDMDLREPHAR
jgi:hypothetical protein